MQFIRMGLYPLTRVVLLVLAWSAAGPVDASTESAKLQVSVPRFQMIGSPPELEFLSDALPVFFRTALLDSETLVYAAEADGGANDTADLSIEGRLLYFRGTLRLDAKVLRKDTGKTASIHSSVVKTEQVYAAVQELAKALDGSLLDLAPESSMRRIAVACFETKEGRGQDEAVILESELSFYLASRLSLPPGLALIPWQELQDWCVEPSEELTRKLRHVGADALVAGHISLTDSKVSIHPEIRVLEPSLVVPLPALEAQSDAYEKVEEILLQDIKDALGVLFEDGQWRLDEVSDRATFGARLAEVPQILNSGENLARALLPLGQAANERPGDPDILVALGRFRLARGHGDEALRLFSAAEQLAGFSPLLSRWIGEAHVERNDLRAAIEAYERAAAAGDDLKALVRLGEIYFIDFQVEKALEKAQRALAQDPRSYSAHLLAGNIFRYQSRLDDAEKAFRMALEGAPENLLAQMSLAEVLLRKTVDALEADEIDKALELVQQSLQLRTTSGNVTLLLQILNQKERFEEAVEAFRKAEEAGLSSPLMYSAGAVSSFELGQVDEALKLFDRALEIAGTASTMRLAVLLNKASILVKAARYPQAVALLEDIESTCDPEWMVFNRFAAWSEMGLPERGLASLNRALEKNPTHIRALESKGFILARLGRFEEALESLEQTLEIEPSSLAGLTNKAWVLGELGRYQEAVAAADKVLEISPESANGRNHKGFALFWLGETEKGMGLIRESISLNPDYGGAHYNLARIYASQRRMSDARRELNLAFEKVAWYREMALRDQILRSNLRVK